MPIEEEIRKLPSTVRRKIERLIKEAEMSILEWDKETYLSSARTTALVTSRSKLFEDKQVVRVPKEECYCNPFLEVCNVFADSIAKYASISSTLLEPLVRTVGDRNIEYFVILSTRKEEKDPVSRLQSILRVSAPVCAKIRGADLYYCIAPRV